jgi:type I restriction enzyme, S subunit
MTGQQQRADPSIGKGRRLPAEGWEHTKFGHAFHSSRTKGKAGLPTLSVTLTEGLIPRDSIDRKMETNLTAEEHLLVKKGDIAYNMMRMWQGASGLAPHDALVSPAYVVLRAKNNIDPFFAAYLFKLAHTVHQFWAYSYGITDDRLRLYFKDFGAIPVNLPPLPEQRKIAEILSTWDAAIGAQARLIANAKRQKKALMQALLPTNARPPKKRLPGFSGAWVRKHFRDAVYVDRNSLGQNTPADFRFRYISLSDVETGTIARDLPELGFASAPSRARRKLNAGDILMATVRPNLQAFARVGSNHAECIASTGFAVLTAKPGFDPGYIYHYLFSEHLTGQIDALVVGSSYPAINSSDIQGLSMHCSGEDEQAAIAQVLNSSDALITDHENQLSVFRKEKSALMQQLLTGKRRVRVEGSDRP